jgi:hypothetical protein
MLQSLSSSSLTESESFSDPLPRLHPIAVDVLVESPGRPGCSVAELASEADGFALHSTIACTSAWTLASTRSGRRINSISLSPIRSDCSSTPANSRGAILCATRIKAVNYHLRIVFDLDPKDECKNRDIIHTKLERGIKK